MRIERSEFGNITIDGQTYPHDVVIDPSGKVRKRKKTLSKREYGTSHIISKAEVKSVFEKGCDLLVVGAGQLGQARLSPEAGGFLAKKGCAVVLQPTPQAIGSFNRSKAKKKIALMHVTC